MHDVIPDIVSQVTVAKRAIALEGARIIAEACIDDAREGGLAICIAILDEAGNPVLFQRMDGAGFATLDFALDKAYTALTTGRPSRAAGDSFTAGATRQVFAKRRMPFAGGLPIVLDGAVVGAVGVSGATEDQDEQSARAGLAALGRRA